MEWGDHMKYELGGRIRKFREARKLSQKELAQLVGVSNSRISNWEQGINRPDADILVSLCKALAVSPSELLDVHLSEDELSSQERAVIQAYRARPELRQAVDILLGIDSQA